MPLGMASLSCDDLLVMVCEVEDALRGDCLASSSVTISGS